MSLNMFGFSAVFLVLTAAFALVNGESCKTKGIYTKDNLQEFQICSENADGLLTLKTLSCGEGSYFSEQEKRCITANGESNDLEVARKSLTTRSLLNSYCPLKRGKLCGSCNTVTSCINRKVVATGKCDDGWSCDAYSNECVNRTVYECTPNYTFTCNTFGIFPDPYYCSRFHVCQGSGLLPTTFKCPYNYRYNLNSGECEPNYDIYFNDSRCPQLPECTEELQVGAVPGNPRMYYACLNDDQGGLRHSLFKCYYGRTFNGEECH